MLKLLWAVCVECLTSFGAVVAWGKRRQLGWSRRGVVGAEMAGELELGKKRKEKEKMGHCIGLWFGQKWA